MGCDIHGFIEFKLDYGWQNFAGEFYLPRDYEFFSKIAGVRGECESFFEPRGLPEDVNYVISSENNIYIYNSDSDDSCTKEMAERWVASGISEYTNEGKSVTNPDHHSHSWLNKDELEEAIDYVNTKCGLGSVSVQYEMIFEVLKKFEEKGCKVRFVFWFDN